MIKVQAFKSEDSDQYTVEFTSHHKFDSIVIGGQAVNPGTYTVTKDDLFYRQITHRRYICGYLNEHTNETMTAVEHDEALKQFQYDDEGEPVFRSNEEVANYAILKSMYPLYNEAQVIGDPIEIPVVKTLEEIDNPFIIPAYAIGLAKTLNTNYCIYNQSWAIDQLISSTFDKFNYVQVEHSNQKQGEYKKYVFGIEISLHLKDKYIKFDCRNGRKVTIEQAKEMYANDVKRVGSQLGRYLSSIGKYPKDVAQIVDHLDGIYSKIREIDSKVKTQDEYYAALKLVRNLKEELLKDVVK